MKKTLLKDDAVHKRCIEDFDNYFSFNKKKCKLKHVKQWLNLFADYYNKEIISELHKAHFINFLIYIVL